MGKTIFVDGTTLTPAQVTAWNGINAGTGMIPDGADTDGHMPKVDLAAAAHVTGVLPLANYTDVTLAKITDGASGTIACKITTTYLTVQQTFNILWEKHFNIVTIHIPSASGTSNSTDLKIELDGGTWPAAILPNGTAGSLFNNVVVTDNSVQKPGVLSMDSASTTIAWTLRCLSGGVYSATGFTNTNGKGVVRGSITYLTQ